MLTAAQQKWIAHLSDVDKILIIPFDPSAETKFEQVKLKIQNVLGDHIAVEHHGASSLGISGQDEIDTYIPVTPDRFDLMVKSLKSLFGSPKSLYPLERARFVTEQDGKHVDVFLINEEHDGWKNAVAFETYLRGHPDALEKYKILKENGDGLTVREYYKRKIEFINDILLRMVNSSRK